MEKNIKEGITYDAREENPLGDRARALEVEDGMVKYEHVSRVRVVLVTTVDDFARNWKID